MRQGWTVKGAVVAASLFAILLRGETEGVVQRIHVSAAAGASGDGTSIAPFATLAAAQQAARELKKRGTVEIIIQSGIYRFDTTLILGPEDSGITWRAAEGAEVVLSGGRVVSNWKEAIVCGRALWQADLGATLLPKGLRDLYVNGQRRPRACSAPTVPAGMLRNEKGQAIGIVVEDPRVAGFARPQDLQVRQQVSWRHYILSVKSVAKAAANRTEIRLADTPEWMAPDFVGFKSFAPAVLENALELLDEPGEWYFDKSASTLYYWPKTGETIGKTHVVVPVLDRLVEIIGASDLCFEGLTFAEAGWHSPAEEGWFGYDPGHIVRGKGGAGGLSFANVFATDARRLRFHRNTFTRLGGVGLHLLQVADAQVVGNVFDDISAEGLGIGAVRDPKDAPQDITVANNLFRRTNQDYAMGPALLTGKLLRATIHHNHVCDVPYIGLLVNKLFGKAPAQYGQVSVRWNRIENVMQTTFDGGAFYTWTDGSSDGTPCVCSDNSIRGVFSKDSQGIYLDNDCRFWTVERNVIEKTLDRWYLVKGSHHALRDNFTDNGHCKRMDLHKPPEIVEERTVVSTNAAWTVYPLAQKTVAEAGLEPAYCDLLTRLPKEKLLNTPPRVTAEAPRTVSLLANARLGGQVSDDGQPYGIRRFEWRKVSGPGEVSFFGQQTRALELDAAFSEPGEYVLRLESSDVELTGHADVALTVTPAEKGSNLAAGLPAEAYSSSRTNTLHEAPANAFDNNPKSYWYPGFPGVGWLQVDLGRAVPVMRVELTLRNDSGDHAHSRSEFEIVASNDPAFQTFVTIRQQGLDPDPNCGGTWSANYAGDGQAFRFVRYWKRKGFDGVVNELRVYGN